MDLKKYFKLYLPFFANLSALIIFSLLTFSRHVGLLLEGNDGANTILLAAEQQNYFGISTSLHSNVLEGIGNITFPFNLSVLPGFWGLDFNHIGNISQAWIYTWFALQLFITVLVVGWNHQFKPKTSFLAAWFLTILAFPYFSSFRIYNLSANSPEFLTIVTIFALVDIGVQHAGYDNWLKSFLYGGIVLLGLTIALVVCPANLVLIVPALLFSLSLAFWRAPTSSIKLRKLTVGLSVISIMLMAGWIEYALGLILDTAGGFFHKEMLPVTPAYVFASILFHGTYKGMSLGPLLYIGSVLGGIIAIWKHTLYRQFAIFLLCTQLLLMCIGTILMSLPATIWDGPSPVYFELPLLPFYALFTIYFCQYLASRLPYRVRSFHHEKILYPFLFIFLMSTYVFVTPSISRSTNHYTLQPTSSPIVHVLEKEIALRPPAVFSGKVVNIIPDKDWTSQFNYFYDLNRIAGNDHQTTGLWLKQIPTLHEYNQVITPNFYRLYRDFLSDKKDIPYRSWSNFNKINIPFLQLLGVRFVITTEPHIKNAIYRTQFIPNENVAPIYLFELQQPNTTGIAAKRIIPANNLNETEKMLAMDSFDLHDAVIMDRNVKLPHSLASVQKSQLSIEKEGFHLKASSQGTTLLILPIEYSHCLHINTIQGKTPQLMRVDLALTGVLFDQFVDIKIDQRTGPFVNPRCKLKDYREFKTALNN